MVGFWVDEEAKRKESRMTRLCSEDSSNCGRRSNSDNPELVSSDGSSFRTLHHQECSFICIAKFTYFVNKGAAEDVVASTAVCILPKSFNTSSDVRLVVSTSFMM